MTTRTLTTNEQLQRAAALLRAGRLVAFPTETVYGLGANALDADAVRRIYEAKGRPSTSPLIVHVSSVEMAKQVAASWPDTAEKLARRYWPGPLTLVLPKRDFVPDEVTAGLGTVGVRIPEHPIALELIRLAGVPLAAPSANRFTQLSPTTADHVRASLAERVDMIVDGGACRVGIESTVVSLAGSEPLLLRPGMIGREQIEAEIGPVALADAAAPEGQAHASPGQHEKHYAPRTRLRIGAPATRERTAFLYIANEAEAEHRVRMPNEPKGYAAALYETLHRLDTLALDEIVVEQVPETPEWDAVRDRLTRAAVRTPR